MEKTYTVTRKFFDSIPPQVLAEGLTLQEAREMCNAPDGSSLTCVDNYLVLMSQRLGSWFNSYTEDS